MSRHIIGSFAYMSKWHRFWNERCKKHFHIFTNIRIPILNVIKRKHVNQNLKQINKECLPHSRSNWLTYALLKQYNNIGLIKFPFNNQ